MVDLREGIWTLERVGALTDLLLPFVLIFTVIFAIFQKTSILGAGPNKKQMNMALSLVISLMVVVPHILGYYPDPSSDPINIINNAIPNVSVVIIAIVIILLLIGLFGGDVKWLGGSISGWIAIIAFLIVTFIFGRAAGWWANGRFPDWLTWLDDPDTQALIVIILVFGIIVWLITKEPSKDKEGLHFVRNLGDLFKGGGDK